MNATDSQAVEEGVPPSCGSCGTEISGHYFDPPVCVECMVPDSAIPMTRDQAGDDWPSWDRGWAARETEAEHLPDPRRKDDSRRAYEAGWATRDIIAWGQEHDRVWSLDDPSDRPRLRAAVEVPCEWDAGFRDRLSVRCPDDSQRLWDEAIERGEEDELKLRTDSEQSGWWTADREIYRRTLELWEACE